MRVSEIMGSRASAAAHRSVGVEYPPGEAHRVMSAAIQLYRQLGVEVEVEDLRIWVPCGEASATTVMSALERLTGRRAFNEWTEQRNA